MKTCARCSRELPLDEFYVVKKTGQPRTWCKECVKDYVIQWQKDNPEKVAAKFRRSRLRLQYGITVETYDQMLAAQGGACAICGAEPQEARLSVDHCHVTGRVRGLLCTRCNRGVGHLRDDPELIRRAAAYIAGASH